MSTTKKNFFHELADHDARLQAKCPVDLMTWKRLKGLVYSLLVLAIVFFTGTRQMATWELAVVAIGSIVVFYIGEAREIEFAGLLTVIFDRNGD